MTNEQLLAENADLRTRLEDAEAALDAIRSGQVDALVVRSGSQGKKVYTLEGAEHPYRVFVEAMQQGAVTLSADGTVFYCNRRFAALMQVPPERLIGTPFAHFVVDADRPRFATMLREVEQSSRHGEVGLKTGAGGVLPAYLHLNTLLLAGAVALCLIVTDLTERKEHEALAKAKRRLADSEARLRTTLASIGDAVIATDTTGRVTFLNLVAESLTGWGQEGAAGKPLEQVFQIIHETTGRPVENPVARVLREGAVVGLGNHTLLVAKDGTHRPIDDSAAPIRDRSGAISGVVLVFRDVTERRRAEAALRQSEAQSRRLLEFHEAVMTNMGEGLYAVDTQGLVTYMNPAAERLFGWKSAELLGRKMHDLTHYQHPDGRPFPIEECAGFRVLHEGKVLRDHDDVFIRKDGTFFPVVYSSSPLVTEGKVAGLVVVFRDVTERKEAEEALRRSERELTDFFENATIGLHWVGPDGTIVRVNQAELDLLGYAKEKYVGRHIAEFHADEQVIGDILRRLQAGENLHDCPTRMRCKDGSIKDVLIDSSVLWEEGRFIHTRCFTRDITEQKRAAEALRDSEQRFRSLTSLAP